MKADAYLWDCVPIANAPVGAEAIGGYGGRSCGLQGLWGASIEGLVSPPATYYPMVQGIFKNTRFFLDVLRYFLILSGFLSLDFLECLDF